MASAESAALAHQKRALRLAMGDARTRLTVEQRARASDQMSARLQTLPEWRETVRGGGGCVAGFAAVRAEIDPAVALEHAGRSGSRVAFPRVSSAGEASAGGDAEVARSRAQPRLRFQVAGAAQLRPGRFGIPEPDVSCPEVDAADVAVMLVPGLAFDARGNRLGFGGGYYDEWLAASGARRPGFVVGVSYDFQIVDACPVNDHDARVDCVVTDTRVIRCSTSSNDGKVAS